MVAESGDLTCAEILKSKAVIVSGQGKRLSQREVAACEGAEQGENGRGQPGAANGRDPESARVRSQFFHLWPAPAILDSAP